MAAANKIIRSPDYAQRLAMACDQNPHCPALHLGRLRWIADEFKRKGMIITTETVKKWSHGESKPKQDKNLILAEILKVDPVWLMMGIDADLDPREKRDRAKAADGVVGMIVGMIQIHGGTVGFPGEKDQDDINNHVDVVFTSKKTMQKLHITLGDVVDEGYRFVVPITFEKLTVVGVVLDDENDRVLKVEVPENLVADRGKRRGGSIEIVMTPDEVAARRIVRFDKPI